jgi:hypothetical protein
MTPIPNWTRRTGRGAGPTSRILVGAALVALAVAACSGGGASPTASPDRSIPAPLPSVDQPSASPEAGDVPQAVIDAAVADAAARAGVEPAAVTVVSAEATTFPSGALGCPEPGMMYTDVLTPGYRVVVEAGGVSYDYRASERGEAVRWCERPPVSG